MPLPRLLDTVLDVWAALSHKPTLRGTPDDQYSRPYWMSEQDARRINAYKLLAAYRANVSRFYVGTESSPRDEYREYGDAALIVNTAMAAVLGEEQTIVVDGADVDPDQADTDQPDPAQEAAAQRQDWLREWADTEQFPAKLLESERQAVGLGDSVYVLAWSPRKGRPRVHVYDPGLYFPDLESVPDDDDFPTVVHMLWEIEEDTRTGRPAMVRRRTWELGAIEPATTEHADEAGVVRRVFRFMTGAGVQEPELVPGDARGPDGTITRRYPWQEPGEDPSRLTCYYTDATWRLDDLKGDWSVYTLPLSAATFARNGDGQLLDRLDLRIDFLPVVHVPNTVAGQDVWGQSVLSTVAQLIDDLSSTDTDLQAASATTGTPMLGYSGTNSLPEDQTVGPGQIFDLGQGGRLDAVDTSGQLRTLMAFVTQLQDRLSVNARMPAVALGRVDPSNVAGITLSLTYGPMRSLVGEMRLVRSEKYALLLKMVQRLAQAGGDLPAGGTPRAEVRFGRYMPADQSGTATIVAQLLAANAISLETAIVMLQQVGVPIEDVTVELERIGRRDYAGALAMFEATGNTAAAAAMLGVPPAPGTVAPPLNIPAPGAGG